MMPLTPSQSISLVRSHLPHIVQERLEFALSGPNTVIRKRKVYQHQTDRYSSKWGSFLHQTDHYRHQTKYEPKPETIHREPSSYFMPTK